MSKLFKRAVIHIIFLLFYIKCEECPKDYPIFNYKKGTCTLEYCTKSEFDEGICLIANSIIKTQWIYNISILSISDNSQTYSKVAYDDEQNLLFESIIDNDNKLFFSMEKGGNGYKNQNQNYYLQKTGTDNFLNQLYSSSILTKNNSSPIYFSISSKKYFNVFNLETKKYSENNVNNIFANGIKSEYNSLLKTNYDYIYIFAFINSNNYMELKRMNITNSINVLKTTRATQRSIPRNSCKCKYFPIIQGNTRFHFVECLDIDENLNIYIRIYNANINHITSVKIDQYKSTKERAFNSYNEIINLVNGESIFLYYNDIPSNSARPIIILKKYDSPNFYDLPKVLNKTELYTKFGYTYSDTENDMVKISDNYFVFVTMTLDEKKHLLIALFNYIQGLSLYINYLDIPFQDLYNINYFSNLYVFPYNGIIGVGYTEEKNNKYINSFILFGYGNTTDPPPINLLSQNINKDKTIAMIKPSEYVYIENNIFSYVLKYINIISIPDSTSGINIIKNSTKEIINGKTSINIDEYLIIEYTESNDNTLTNENSYEIIFVPYLEEQSNLSYLLQCYSYREIFGVDIEDDNEEFGWIPEKYLGRETKIKINILNCYKNCLTCNGQSNDELNQKCEECLPGYHFEENTNNCFNEARKGFYYDSNRNIFSKCHDNCETCFAGEENDKQNCLTCKQNYLLYNSTNCLNCKYLNIFTEFSQKDCTRYIPVGYYLNNTEYNTINKCHENCYSCNKGPEGNNMNCLNCDYDKNLFLIENTQNCENANKEGYYLKESKVLSKCHPLCKTCSKGPTEDNMNCISCDNNLGYFLNGTNCEFKEIENMYYIPESNSYSNCYENCLYCFDKEKNLVDNDGNNYIDMNCLTCNESNNFFLFNKTGNNCLNCKEQNKYVNFLQTDCIDEIPEGYFLLNNNTNQIEQCYPSCKTCNEKGILSEDMKCNSCFENYNLYNGNCLPHDYCPNYFYYESNEKICLNKKEECPDNLPFYYTDNSTKECIDFCSLRKIIEGGCKIANIEGGLNQLLNLLYMNYKYANLNNYETFFSYKYNNEQIYIIKIKLTELNSKIEENRIKLDENIKRLDADDYLYIGNNIYFEEQEINLEECLEILNINNNKIIMMKIDIKNMKLNKIQTVLRLYDYNNNINLDLSICSSYNKTIIVDNNKLIEEKRQEKITEYIVENNKIYDNDKCTVTYNEDGTDILLEDRLVLEYEKYLFSQNEIYQSYPNITINVSEICPLNFILIDFDFNTKNATCLYSINLNNINNITDNLLKLNEEYFYMNKSYIEIEGEPIEDSNKRNIERNITTDISSESNIKYMKCISNISSEFKNNYVLIILLILDIAYIVCIFLYLFYYRKIYLSQFEEKIDIPINKIIGLKGSFTSYKEQYQPELKEIRTYKKNNVFSSVNSDIHTINLNSNINNNQNKHNLKNKKTTLAEELTNRHYNKNFINSNNNNINTNYKNDVNLYNNNINYSIGKLNGNKNKGEKKDFDLVDYSTALEKDTRNFCEIFISLMKKKQIYIFAFTKDNYVGILKISLLFFCLINYFTTNVFFFNDKVIHQIYLDKGKYNFSYQIKYICLSALISSIFLYLAKFVFIVKKNNKEYKQIYKCIDFSSIIIILLFIFYWLYVGSYTSVFIKSQKHISINFLLTLVACTVYEFILTIFSIILRKIAIDKGDSPKIYKISLFLILLKA